MDSLGMEYGSLLERVKSAGDVVSPRGSETIEARPLCLKINNPRQCVVKRPGMSRAFMWAEQMLLVSGEHDTELLQRYSKRGAEMLNHYGAYGPRIRDQLPEITRELRRGDSRRAMAYICRPDDLKYAEELNMPCTLGYHFLIRNDKLELICYMRSWDLVWGLSYDIPNAVQLQMLVAADLGLKLGPYSHVAGSGHVYERHYGLEVGETDYELPSLARRLGRYWLPSLADAVEDAKRALWCENMWPGGETPSEVLPQQWKEPFAVFKRAAERSRE
jgi:thymidylate synthase